MAAATAAAAGSSAAAAVSAASAATAAAATTFINQIRAYPQLNDGIVGILPASDNICNVTENLFLAKGCYNSLSLHLQGSCQEVQSSF